MESVPKQGTGTGPVVGPEEKSTPKSALQVCNGGSKCPQMLEGES